MTFSAYFVRKISSFAVFPAIDQNREDYVSSIETRKNENARPEDGSKYWVCHWFSLWNMVLLIILAKNWRGKGQLISKCLFGDFKFFQKRNENKSTWGIIVVQSNVFVRFLEEFGIPKSPFETPKLWLNNTQSKLWACHWAIHLELIHHYFF